MVEHFRTKAKIMIATEAAAEGINLQFCSMVVNYDLPWNPQRIEQRIGRCHRYGQQHDVVVINFLNKANAADLRVFELLDEKFRLFAGVFGASDEVLGDDRSQASTSSAASSTSTRTAARPKRSTLEFEQLRLELDEQITETMDTTRMKLLEHFDAEVHDRLRVSLEESTEFIDKATEQLWRVTTHSCATKPTSIRQTDRSRSQLRRTSRTTSQLGRYRLSRDEDEDTHRYRPQHPLALAVLNEAVKLETPFVELSLTTRAGRFAPRSSNRSSAPRELQSRSTSSSTESKPRTM